MNKDEIIDAEFRGFFYADGSAALVRYKRTKKYKDKIYQYTFYRPQINIIQRWNNSTLLEEFQSRYGGSIWVRRKSSTNLENTQLCHNWTNTNLVECKRICEVLLKNQFTHKKRKNVQILHDYISWKLERGLQTKLSEEDYAKVGEWWKDCRQKFHKSKE